MASEVVGYEVDVADRGLASISTASSSRRYPFVFREGPLSVSVV